MNNPDPRFGLDKTYIAGVDARSIRSREATLFRADGVVSSERFVGFRRADHPVRSSIRWLRTVLLRSRPPLLCEEGNVPAQLSCHADFHSNRDFLGRDQEF